MPILSSYLRKRRFNLIRPYLKGDILDIGCGPGSLVLFLNAKQYYVGIDRDKSNIEILKDKYPNYEFFCADVENGINIKFTRMFDTITMIALIEHIKDPSAMIECCYHLLEKGGYIIITTPSPFGNEIHKFAANFGLVSKSAVKAHVNIYNSKRLKSLFEEFGFKSLIFRSDLGVNQLAVFAKE